MRHVNFVVWSGKRCQKCEGFGILQTGLPARCILCKGTGIEYDHDSIKIGEGCLSDLLNFAGLSHDGEKWMAFVDWRSLYGFHDFIKLIDDGWVDQHSDKPPLHGNYRDDFKETLYTISLKGRLVVMNPGLYVERLSR